MIAFIYIQGVDRRLQACNARRTFRSTGGDRQRPMEFVTELVPTITPIYVAATQFVWIFVPFSYKSVDAQRNTSSNNLRLEGTGEHIRRISLYIAGKLTPGTIWAIRVARPISHGPSTADNGTILKEQRR